MNNNICIKYIVHKQNLYIFNRRGVMYLNAKKEKRKKEIFITNSDGLKF